MTKLLATIVAILLMGASMASAVPGNAKQIVSEAAKAHGIEPRILWGLFGTETNYGHNMSTSSAGAVGPFQFEPATAKSLGINPYDFKQAAYGAAAYLSQYRGRGVGGMLSAYNAGPAGGYQSGYVNTTLQNARSYGTPNFAPGSPQSSPSAGPGRSTLAGTYSALVPTGVRSVNEIPGKLENVFNKAGYEQARRRFDVGTLLKASGEGKENPLIESGLIPTKAPTAEEFTKEREAPGRPGVTETLFSKQTGNIQGFQPGQPTGGNAGAGGGRAGFGAYTSPFGNAEVTPERVDQGKDYAMKTGTALKAMGDGVVKGIMPNWYQGQPYLWYELTTGPLAGHNIYIAEGIEPLVKPGDRIHAGQVIARYVERGSGIETGYSEAGGETKAKAREGYAEGAETGAGREFQNLLRKVGART